MWVFLSDAFLSIVHTPQCGPDELLVRARRAGDIDGAFPEANVVQTLDTDYRYRAVVTRREVADALTKWVDVLNYKNFKASMPDDHFHDAAMKVWTAMADLQPTPPYSALRPEGPAERKKGRKRKKAGRLR